MELLREGLLHSRKWYIWSNLYQTGTKWNLCIQVWRKGASLNYGVLTNLECRLYPDNKTPIMTQTMPRN